MKTEQKYKKNNNDKTLLLMNSTLNPNMSINETCLKTKAGFVDMVLKL